MELDILKEKLEVTENPGLDPFDTRLIDIATLVQNGNYEAAALQSEEVLKEQIYDIRVIGYFLYGVFLEKGPSCLKEIFDVLTSLLTENWDAIGPVKKREKHTQTILVWFMKQLLKKLEYEEKKESDIWKLWQEEVSSDEVYEAREALQNFRKVLTMKLEDLAEPVLDNLLKVNKWLESFEQLVYKEPEPEEETEEENIEETEEEEEETSKEDSISKTKKKKALSDVLSPSISYQTSGEGVSVIGSHHLSILLEKLKAFDVLIQKEAFLQAAIVAEDIKNIIDNFDPKKYFPSIFSRFCLLYALRIEELMEQQEYKDTPIWQALSELYSVDINSFVNIDENMINISESPMQEKLEEEYLEEGENEVMDDEEYEEDENHEEDEEDEGYILYEDE